MSEGRKNVAILLENNYERPFRLIDGLLSVPGVRDRCAFRSFLLYEAGYDDLFTEEWKPDGIIACYDENAELWLRDVEIPVVNLVGTEDGIHASVGTDYRSLAQTVVEHFDALGYRNILNLETEGIDQKLLLDPLIRPLCAARGIEFMSVSIRDGIDCTNVGELNEICPEFVRALNTMNKPLGIYTRHDRRGRLVVDYLVREGYSIPDEVGVLACFDSFEAKLCDPPLSSIVLRDIETGARGIQKLEKLMNGEALLTEHEKVPVRGVRVRGSTLGQSEGDLEILRARSIIRARAREGITVDMLVNEMNVSRSTFEKRFIALTGHSPAQEIRQVRLDWARELLLTTDLPMSQLAPLVGFKDRRAFVVFFKREAGTTPTAFRDRNRI
ncbi:MAG: helix-turn-helix domain-containing protein [Akkermansiaceae bacterium]|nr:helix-turn-helix domain-containing protein [Akkermansiaceae bacterium]